MSSQSCIDSLEPDFRAVVQVRLKELEDKTGRTWLCTSARRTMAEQGKLYAQGRTTPGKIVTNAKPGQSAHNFGLGADFAPLKSKGVIDWNAPRSIWKQLADGARLLGYTAGFYFKSIVDMPHIESPRWKAAQALWRAGKLVVA